MELFIENPFIVFVGTATFITIMLKGLGAGIKVMYGLLLVGYVIVLVGMPTFFSGVVTSLVSAIILKSFFNADKLL